MEERTDSFFKNFFCACNLYKFEILPHMLTWRKDRRNFSFTRMNLNLSKAPDISRQARCLLCVWASCWLPATGLWRIVFTRGLLYLEEINLVWYRISEWRSLVHPQNFKLILFLSGLWLGGNELSSYPRKMNKPCKDAFCSPRLSIELEDSDFSLEWGRCGWPWAEMRLQNNGTIVGAARGGSRVWLYRGGSVAGGLFVL